MKPTLREISNAFALYIWNADYQLNGNTETTLINPITLDGLMFGDKDYLDAKMILRPLYSIRDHDDALEVAKIATSWDDRSPLDAEDVPEWLDEIFTGNCALTADYVNGRQFQELIDFLRSKGYDCGYGSMPSLIEAGLAIALIPDTDGK